MTTGACICGLTYAKGYAQDEARHKIFHSEYLIGPSIPSILASPVIGEVDGFSLHLVDERTSFDRRRKISHVAMVAQRSMLDYPAGYDGTITEDDQRLYVLVDKRRIIAFALTAMENRFWRLSWTTDETVELIDSNAEVRVGPKIGRVWTAAKYRKAGLANRLVLATIGDLNTGISQIGWELPLSKSGKGLVRSMCQSAFFGCGDIQSLRDTLFPEAGASAA